MTGVRAAGRSRDRGGLMDMTDSGTETAYLAADRRLRAVADAYEELGERMLYGVEHVGGDRPRPRSDEGRVTAKMAATPAPADLTAATVRMEVAAWASWLAHAVMDARDGAGQPWVPGSTDPAELLREIARDHLGVFLAHPIEAEEFLRDASDYKRRVEGVAFPTGERWLRLGIPCSEAGTDDMGRRIPCGGEYRMWMRPEQDVLGDMVCDRDRGHTITPVEWQRALRRRPVDQEAAARLARNLRAVKGLVA